MLERKAGKYPPSAAIVLRKQRNSGENLAYVLYTETVLRGGVV